MARKTKKVRPVGAMEANVEKMEAQLKTWAVQIDGLTAKAEQAGEQAKIDFRQGIDDLKAKRAAAQIKVEEFKAAGSEKWEGFKGGIERAWGEIEVAFKELKL